MQKILYTLLLSIFFALCASADNRKLSDEELIKKILELNRQQQELDKQVVEAKAKTAMMKEETTRLQAESAKIKKLGETVDKVATELGIEDKPKEKEWIFAFKSKVW